MDNEQLQKEFIKADIERLERKRRLALREIEKKKLILFECTDDIIHLKKRLKYLEIK